MTAQYRPCISHGIFDCGVCYGVRYGSCDAPTVQSEAVEHPSHYNQHPAGIECIDVAEHFNFNLGNGIKYLWRAGLKGPDPAEDLRKARWYIEREIKRLEREADAG